MKQRLTIAFFVTASGKNEKPIVMWKSENPRCLRQCDKSVLPITYVLIFSQAKAWTTGDILESILLKLSKTWSARIVTFCILWTMHVVTHRNYTQFFKHQGLVFVY